MTSCSRNCVAGLCASVAILALAAGCGPDDNEAQGGTLGNGSFNYQCVSSNDPECPSTSLDPNPAAFPTIALGGTFNLVYDSTNSSYPSATVIAASPDFFVNQGETFTAIRTGKPGVVAETPSGTILDFTQIEVAPIDSIQVAETDDSDDDDTTQSYGATAMGAVNEPLGGEVLYVWSSSDPSVLAIEGGQPTPSSTVKVLWLKNGVATLTAKSGTTTGTLQVNVSVEDEP